MHMLSCLEESGGKCDCPCQHSVSYHHRCLSGAFDYPVLIQARFATSSTIDSFWSISWQLLGSEINVSAVIGPSPRTV